MSPKLSLILFICFIYASNILYGQGYRALTVEDFKGKPTLPEPFLAQTQWRIGYSYQVRNVNGHFTLDFVVNLKLDEKASWIKRNNIRNLEHMKELISHEQKHFQIGAIMQKDLLRTLRSYVYTENYKQEANQLFNQLFENYKRIELRYDNETRHMLDSVNQDRWNMLIEKAYQDGYLKESEII
ncbi:DUF922 domain-containing protein [Olivibacter domesticus]|uniref:DUF922 domain-containing protein n=1 Tax=Olivibacter domesticus TaxID=407022 RepID=A0A1H7LTP7_OLID1|nr:DUF922 domain-containing protein [Olivibacter domesticus]SEL02300.1 protein of unknown function [Olivibacter domesticus]